MRAEAVFPKTQQINRELVPSGFSVIVPESVIKHANKHFTSDNNKFLGLLVQLGVFMEEGKIYQVFNERKEKLKVGDFNSYTLTNNSKVLNREFDQNSFNKLRNILKVNFNHDVEDWLSRLYVFSVISPNLQLEIESGDVLKKLDLPVYFEKSNYDSFQFNAEDR